MDVAESSVARILPVAVVSLLSIAVLLMQSTHACSNTIADAEYVCMYLNEDTSIELATYGYAVPHADVYTQF